MKPKQENRRDFLRGLRFGDQTAKPSTDQAGNLDTPDESSVGSKQNRKLTKRQFGLRSLFYLTLVVALLLAEYRESIVRRPLLFFGATVVAILLALVQEGCIRLFDAFLWQVFGENDRRGH
jgi:hypothetical protein